MNERLARHYGIPGVYGSHFRRVALGDTPRRGLLFGIGGVCYALLAFRDPFTGKNADEVERNVMFLILTLIVLTSLLRIMNAVVKET